MTTYFISICTRPFSNESQVTSLNPRDQTNAERPTRELQLAPLLYLRQITSQPPVPSASKLRKQQGKVQGRGT